MSLFCLMSPFVPGPFLTKTHNHESNPFKDDVFIKFKCFCQKKKKKNKRNNIGCYLCLLLRSSVFLNDIPKNCVSPQPEKRIYYKKYSKRNNIPSSLAFILESASNYFWKTISSKVTFEKIRQFRSCFDRYRNVRCPKIKTEHPRLSSRMTNFLKNQNIGQRIFVVSFWHSVGRKRMGK